MLDLETLAKCLFEIKACGIFAGGAIDHLMRSVSGSSVISASDKVSICEALNQLVSADNDAYSLAIEDVETTLSSYEQYHSLSAELFALALADDGPNP